MVRCLCLQAADDEARSEEEEVKQRRSEDCEERIYCKWILEKGRTVEGKGRRVRGAADKMEGVSVEALTSVQMDEWAVCIYGLAHCPDNGTSIIDLSLIRLPEGLETQGEREDWGQCDKG